MNGVNLLIWGDTETSPALRHEVPLSIGDPFLYLESGGRRAVVTNALEETRIARAAPDLERLLIDALGRDELLATGWPRHDIEFEVCVRGAEQMGITDAVVPPEFPRCPGRPHARPRDRSDPGRRAVHGAPPAQVRR